MKENTNTLRGASRAHALAARLALANGRTYDPTNTPAPRGTDAETAKAARTWLI